MPLTPQQKEEYEFQLEALRTKLRNSANDLQEAGIEVSQTSPEPQLIPLLLAKVSRAQEHRTDFENAWDRITLICVKLGIPDSFPDDEARRMKLQVRNDYDAVKAVEIRLKMEPSRAPPTTAPNMTANDTSIWSRQFLEKLQLPRFDGDVKAWTRFRDIFSSLVHDDPTIPPVAKLHLLISSLSGEARSIVNKFEICDASYPLAWTALKKQYDNNRVLATAFLDQILNFRLPSNPTLKDFQRFMTDVADSVSAFKALRLENTEDKLLALAVLKTLDTKTRQRFELQQVDNEFPTLDSIITFIRNQCQAYKLSFPNDPPQPPKSRSDPAFQKMPLRSSPKYNTFKSSHHAAPETPQHQSIPVGPPSPKPRSPKQRVKMQSDGQRPEETNPPNCSFCKRQHILSRCPSFLGLSGEDRLSFASKWQGCRNCLNSSHKVQECKSRFVCRICSDRHHTLLHPSSNESPSSTSKPVCGHTEPSPIQNTTVVLGTARAAVRDPTGRLHFVRLLLDCGSQQSYISRECADRLHLKIRPNFSTITGLGASHVANSYGDTKFFLWSLHGNHRVPVTASVLDQVTSQLPQQPIPSAVVQKFQKMQLADPRFHEPQEIDILLGANLFDQIVTGAFHRPDPNSPAALPTIFGMVIMGSYRSSASQTALSFHSQDSRDINRQLQAFWELEEPAPVTRKSPEDAFCENHFVTTHSRDPTGRYVVRLPFTALHHTLGENRSLAIKRFRTLETKLSANESLRSEYQKFMKEYEDLGHMSIAQSPSAYIIPHFGVMQGKLRVVFDASSPSSNMSLNDILLPGPKLQEDICDVLLHFRLFPVAITTDMVKMYRQILVHPEDRHVQHIFWRNSPDSKLVEYELNTVTYGMSPSAFLAIRCVRQLLADEGTRFPLVVQRLRKAIFVDDICTGADSEKEAEELCNQLIKFFGCGGFPLSKWSSNHPSVLPNHCETTQNPLSIQSENSPGVKVLGLIWHPTHDSFSYKVHKPCTTNLTKRTTLSFIARMFDPLGFLTPVTFKAKIFLQEIWKLKLDWDDELPLAMREKWLDYVTSWQSLESLSLPRYLQSRFRPCNLVGFCDASNLGYAAVLYLQVETSPDRAECFIIKAKSKVAPIKFTSIPRLELCGALLLAKLISSIDLSTDLTIQGQYLFTDSRVALAWINTPTHLLKVFEANRVASISELAPNAEWRHVKTEENPADIASRGLSPSDISSNKMWWNGPSWLSKPPALWTPTDPPSDDTPDYGLHDASSFHTTPKDKVDSSWMERFSRLQNLLRVVVRIMRFTRRSEPGMTALNSPIRASELRRAAQLCARSAQLHHYPKGPDTPDLRSLNPFLDQLGVLRVGGRLQNAPISYSERHPIIIPKSSHLARLIVDDTHERYYHAGPTLTLSILRSQYWIPSGMRFVKSQLSRCVPCFRRRPTAQQVIMAPLPSSRFAIGRAFQQTGIDYAGPFQLKDSHRRKPIITKGYLCLFVCMATKALHLEAVTSLSTEAFLASLDRFIARRGRPSVIHSDNATNFVGASRYLKDIEKFLHNQSDSIAEHLAKAGTEWTFIPPRSPHFGGLWEAGVKSVKTLLVSSTGSQAFTYEEFATILARVESFLNSRPLCPMTDDPESFDALTPGHFLLGSAPCAPPEESLEELHTNRLSRWQQVQQKAQFIWARWRREYLNTLHQRGKWRKNRPSLQPSDLVVLCEKRAPSGHWPLARVVAVHPGPDGNVRVATVRTSSGATYKRTVQNLAKLPSP